MSLIFSKWKNILAVVVLAAAGAASAQITAPNVPVTGNLGSGGVFPVLNSGNLVFPSDAPHTMTYPEMTAFILKVTSAVPLTATRNLIAPVGYYPFIVENLTTGGQSIVLIGSSGTGVTIPNGSAVMIMGDGTNFVSASGSGSGGGVSSINSTTGAFTFSGSGVSCTGTTCTFSSGSGMVYPSGTGIPAVLSGTSWGTTYNAGNTIPANFIPTLNQNTTGTAANVTGSTNGTLTTLSALSLPTTQLTGTVTNAQLVNSSTTVSGVACVLGGTCSPPTTCAGSASPCYLQQVNPTAGPAATTTTASITTSTTAIPVASCAGFTFAPGNIIGAENVSNIEWMVGTSCVGTTLNVTTRGFWNNGGVTYSLPASNWASGTTIIQVTKGSSLSATSAPYYYELANGAVGYFGTNNIAANTLTANGMITAASGFTASGVVDLAGGTGSALYQPQFISFNEFISLSACGTSGGIFNLPSTNYPWFVGASNSFCTTGTNNLPPNVFAFVPGAISTVPAPGATPALTISLAGVVNVPTGGNYEINGVPISGGGGLPSGTGIVAVNSGTGALATATQVLGSFSTGVYYASKLSGATPYPASYCAPGASATGLTDSWAALNAITSAGGNLLETDACFALSATLNVASNTTMHGTSLGNGFIMLPASNAHVLQNVHLNAPTTASGTGGYLVSNQSDTNIVVSNLMLNANSLQAATGTNSQGTAHAASAAGQFLYCTNFVGVNGLVIDHNTCYDSAAFEIFSSNNSNEYVTNNTIYPVLPIVAKKFTDCVHFIGPDSSIFTQNNIETCGDDSNAYNADDGNRTGSGDVNASYVASYVKWGPIQHVHDDNNELLNTYYGLRLYSATELIDDFESTNYHGSACGNTFTLTKLSALGSGNFGTIKITDPNLPTSGACNSFSVPYNFWITANYANIQINGLQLTNPGANWPLITHNVASPGVLSLRNTTINTTTSTVSGLIDFTGGAAPQISVNGLNWDDISSGTGSVFYGSVVPVTVNCSNYNGPNRLLGSGFAPTYQNGDCFTNTYSAGATVYVNTTFNEGTSGTALAGTTPATCTNGCTGTWTAASGGPVSGAWSYTTNSATLSGACASGGPDNFCPVYINVGTANYTMRTTVSQFDTGTPSGLSFVVRWTNNNNFVAFLQSSAGVWGLYDVVAGVTTSIGSATLGTSTGIWTVVMNGTSAKLTNPSGTTLSGTISGSNTATNVGLSSNLAVFSGSDIVTALSVKSF